jgi:tetratricopeptide (TPR) repeat protein
MFDASVASYRRVIDIQPDNVDGWLDLADALSECGSYQEALTAYNRVITMSPDWSEAYYQKCKCCLQTGLFQEAIESAKRSLELEPHKINTFFQDFGQIQHSNPEILVKFVFPVYEWLVNEKKYKDAR